YTMTEIAEDESILSVDSTGLLTLEIESNLDTFYVGDQLNLDPLQENFNSDIGSFSVSSPGTESTSIELREIFDEAESLNGTMVVVPPFSFSTESKPLDSYDNFDYVIIETGNITLQVVNNLLIPLGSPLTLEIWDTNTNALILTTTDSVKILPGDSAYFSINLSGKSIPNALSIKLTGASPGSEGNPVLIDATSSFAVEAEISDLLVTEASAQVPTQMVSRQEELAITDSLVITEAVIAEGAIQLSLEGNIPLDAWIIYELPDFISSTDSMLIDSVFIQKGFSQEFQINLRNYVLRPQLANFGQQKVRFQWTVKTVDTGTEMVLVKSSDFMTAYIHISEIIFSQISGKVGEKKIEIDQNEIEFDIPADLDSIFFETARMELFVHNGINFPAKTDFMIEGQNESGAVEELNVQGNIQPALQPGIPVTSVIVLDQQNSNIRQFISILPSLIRVFGQVKLGNPSWIGTVSNNDYVNGTIKLRAPLALKLPPQTIESDANKLDISEDTRKDIEDNLSSGSFSAEIKNHLPLGAAVEFIFSQDDSTTFQNPILQIGPIEVDAAFIDSSGFVKKALVSEINLALTEDEMRTFLKSPLYAGLRIMVDGTNDELIRVRGSDYLEIKSYGKIKLKINQD
ncbi:MAG: hypothetical protein ACE5JB_04555, partial [bacterium]